MKNNMISKWILYRNKFIGNLVTKYTKDLDYVLDIGSGEELLRNYINPILFYIGVDKEPKRDYSIKADIMKWSPPDKNKSEYLEYAPEEGLRRSPYYISPEFSVIVMQEVLAHLPLPMNENMIPLLIKVKCWLKPDSHLIISVPNFSRLTNRISKPRYLDETHNIEFFPNDIDLFTCGHYEIIEKHFIILYLPCEKQIGWLIPDFLRRFVLRFFPSWSSHIVYVLKPKV